MRIRLDTPGIERLRLVGAATQRNAVAKPQAVRLVDIWFLGPLMILAGFALSRGGGELGASLVASGVGTIAYNHTNYEKQRHALQEAA